MTADKTPATLAVDVLAVNTDRLRTAAQSDSQTAKTNALLNAAREIDQLRDKFADLIEALTLARSELSGLPHSLGYSFTHLPKIDAALARVKGESA